MTTVAVIAHRKKHLGGGLIELRDRLASQGIDTPLWFEVDKSRKAPKRARLALEQGADHVLIWGGDGMVQRCIDVLAGRGATIGILPAGTANLFATNLGIPRDFDGALDVALHGTLRALDVGVINGEHFAVMAGTGFDAEMIKEADRGLKDRFGRAAYVWTGAKAASGSAQRLRGPRRRPQVVRRQGELRLVRQRRSGRRGGSCVRGRPPRRRASSTIGVVVAKTRLAVVAGDRPHAGRSTDALEVRQSHSGPEGRRSAQAQSAATSWTGEPGVRRSACGFASSPARSPSASRRADEHRAARPRDLGAERR